GAPVLPDEGASPPTVTKFTPPSSSAMPSTSSGANVSGAGALTIATRGVTRASPALAGTASSQQKVGGSASRLPSASRSSDSSSARGGSTNGPAAASAQAAGQTR